ncbi:MAG: Hpt domain-containing protein [Candidatus Zixiibacteriota bacterium]
MSNKSDRTNISAEAHESAGTDTYDISRLYAIAADDQELVCNLIDIFLRQYPEQIEELASSLADDNHDGVRRISHKLKGTLLNMGAEVAAGMALRMEKAAECSDIMLMDDLHGSVVSICHALADRLRRERQSLLDAGIICE